MPWSLKLGIFSCYRTQSSEVNENLPSCFNFLWIQPRAAAEIQRCSPELLRNTLEIGMLKIKSAEQVFYLTWWWYSWLKSNALAVYLGFSFATGENRCSLLSRKGKKSELKYMDYTILCSLQTSWQGCCIFMRASHTSSDLLEHPTSSLWWFIGVLRGSDTFVPGLHSLHPGLNDSNGECGNFQECFLSNSNPQQPESALQSPLLLEMMVNWLVRHCFSRQ